MGAPPLPAPPVDPPKTPPPAKPPTGLPGRGLQGAWGAGLDGTDFWTPDWPPDEADPFPSGGAAVGVIPRLPRRRSGVPAVAGEAPGAHSPAPVPGTSVGGNVIPDPSSGK